MRCQRLSADSVAGPKTPSAGTPMRRCSARTPPPRRVWPPRAVRGAPGATGLALEHRTGAEPQGGARIRAGDAVGDEAVGALPALERALRDRAEDAVGADAELLLQLPDVAAARLDDRGRGLVRAARLEHRHARDGRAADSDERRHGQAARRQLDAGGRGGRLTAGTRARERLRPELLAGKIPMHFDMTSLSG